MVVLGKRAERESVVMVGFRVLKEVRRNAYGMHEEQFT